MRRMSPKRREIMESAAPWRKKWLEERDGCDICGAMPHLVHEITRGPSREQSLMEPCCILALCTHCHGMIHDETKEWPPMRQLAWLACSRPYDLDLVRFSAIYGKEVVFQDLIEHLEPKWY